MAVDSGFWPDVIRPHVLTPLDILEGRANELSDLTKGTLIGRVATSFDETNEQTFHSLDVLVPMLQNLRQRLLTVRHRSDMVYPAYIDADLVASNAIDERLWTVRGVSKFIFFGTPQYEAPTDVALIDLLKKALHSSDVQSTLVSLIAMANRGHADAPGNAAEASGGNDLDRASGLDCSPSFPLKTQGVKDLVGDVLREVAEPYSEDVIEDVFVNIEGNQSWMARYKSLVENLGATTVNKAIGSWVRKLTGRQAVAQVVSTRSSLTQSYSKLRVGA